MPSPATCWVWLPKTQRSNRSSVQDLNNEYMQKGSFPKPFSAIARELGYPRFKRATANPFRMLAEMPLPIYITTSHHEFLEFALAQTQNKRPVSEIFYWGEHLERIPSVFDGSQGGNLPLKNHWSITSTAWIATLSRSSWRKMITWTCSTSWPSFVIR